MPQTQTETPAGQPKTPARPEAAKLARLFLKAVHALPPSNERTYLQSYMRIENIPLILADVALNAEMNTLKNIHRIGEERSENLRLQLKNFGLPEGSLSQIFSETGYESFIIKTNRIYLFTEQGLEHIRETSRTP